MTIRGLRPARQTANGGVNLIEIDGDELRLGRATFPFFMRLVTGLFETENGFLPLGRFHGGGGLADEGYSSPKARTRP